MGNSFVQKVQTYLTSVKLSLILTLNFALVGRESELTQFIKGTIVWGKRCNKILNVGGVVLYIWIAFVIICLLPCVPTVLLALRLIIHSGQYTLLIVVFHSLIPVKASVMATLHPATTFLKLKKRATQLGVIQ